MKEVVRRRYMRMIEEETPLPDLIITDGGKGQMGVVREVVVEELHLDIPIAGLAKAIGTEPTNCSMDGHRQVVGLDVKSVAFHVLSRIQDEVHRYAISFTETSVASTPCILNLTKSKVLGPKRRNFY